MSSRRAWLRLLSAGGAFAACRPGPSDLPSGTDRWHPYAGGLADLLIVGGTIWTMDPEHPEVGAVAARGGRVIAIGDPAHLTHLHGPRTRVLDLGGGFAVPGLTDAHAHLVGLGAELEEVDLRGATSVDEAVDRVLRSAPPTGWVLGRGWDQNDWPDKAMPHHAELSPGDSRGDAVRPCDGNPARASARVAAPPAAPAPSHTAAAGPSNPSTIASSVAVAGPSSDEPPLAGPSSSGLPSSRQYNSVSS